MLQPITQIIYLIWHWHLLWMWKWIGYNDISCKWIQLQLMVAPNIIIPSHTFVPAFGFGTSHGQRSVVSLVWTPAGNFLCWAFMFFLSLSRFSSGCSGFLHSPRSLNWPCMWCIDTIFKLHRAKHSMNVCLSVAWSPKHFDSSTKLEKHCINAHELKHAEIHSLTGFLRLNESLRWSDS